MANGSATLNDTTSETRTCPEWCISAHRDGDRFHYGDKQTATDIYGRLTGVELGWDEDSGKVSVSVGGVEFDHEQIRVLAELLGRVSAQAILTFLEAPKS
jgi:hypothetical protein